MSISQFPPATTGGGGAGLPIGATTLEFGGKLTGSGYSHPGTLTAGKYLFEIDNTVKVTLGDNNQTFFVKPGETITIPADESNFFVEPKAVLGGPATLVKSYPLPGIKDSAGYGRLYGAQHWNENTGFAAWLGGYYNNTSQARVWFRDMDTGGLYPVNSGTSQYLFSSGASGQYEYAVVALNDNNTVLVFAEQNSSYARLYRCDTSAQTVASTNLTIGTDITNNPVNGFAGAAISADGQTIVVPYRNLPYALVSTDGGDTFTDVNIGVTPRSANFNNSHSIWWVHDRFFLTTTSSGNFAHSVDGSNWTQVAIAGASGDIPKPARSATGKWMFGSGSTTNTLWQTTDLTSFSAVTVTWPTASLAWNYGLAYNDGKFIVTYNSGSLNYHMVSEDDGVTWFNVTSDTDGYGNDLSGTNLWYYNGSLRYTSFSGQGSFTPVYWDALWNKWIMGWMPNNTDSNRHVRPAMSMNTDNYLRWHWGDSSQLLGSQLIYDDEENKTYYAINPYANELSTSVEYDEATGDFKTLPEGRTGNGDWETTGTVSTYGCARLSEPDATNGITSVFLHYHDDGLYYSYDIDAVIPTFSRQQSWTRGINARMIQWPDGSVNGFTGTNNTSYVRNIYFRKYNNGPTSIGIQFNLFNWGTGTSDREDDVWNSMGQRPLILDIKEDTGTYSVAAGQYAYFDASYPTTGNNLNANSESGLQVTGGTGALSWRYYTGTSTGNYDPGLNISFNNGAAWAKVAGFQEYLYVFKAIEIESEYYFLVRAGTTKVGVYKAEDFIAGRYPELFSIGFDNSDKFLAYYYASTNKGGGLYRPDLGDDLYHLNGVFLYKVFGSTSKPDTNLFVYNANNEVL